MMTRFSVILPVHNDAKLLPYSLPSVFALNPDEIVCLLDRCTDNSGKVAERLANKFCFNGLRLIEVNEESLEWKTRLGYLRFLGQNLASNDLVLWTGSDLVLDSNRMNETFSLLGKNEVGLVTFMHRDYPTKWANMIKRFYIKLGIKGLGKHKFMGGILFYNRQLAGEVESVESLKNTLHSCDTHLRMAINSKYRSLCVLAAIFHLRPRGWERDVLRGRLYWSIARRGWFTTFLASLGMLQPLVIKGYIHERYGEHEQN